LSESVERIAEEVTFEIEHLDRLFVSYRDLLRDAQERTPGLVEMTALALVLHAFYQGLENIFLAIAKRLDGESPTSAHWHRDLLAQMARQTARRHPVISAQLETRLVSYLGFRHFTRHAYPYFLEWDELKDLLIPLYDVWTEVKQELNKFLDSLRSVQDSRS